MGVELGYRKPVFDIEVTAEKSSPYTRLSRNEMALQFYQAGFFDPSRADQALTCLDMMDFDGREKVIEKVAAGKTAMLSSLSAAPEGGRNASFPGGEAPGVRAARERVIEGTRV